jgi:hypothetical protein
MGMPNEPNKIEKEPEKKPELTGFEILGIIGGC